MKVSLTLFISGKQKTIEVDCDETNLDLSGRKITSLKGAVFPPNLIQLSIWNNEIDSLKGLPPSLTELYISGNHIKSLEGLPPNLTELSISHNQIKSLISPQGEALLPQNLTTLLITSNQIETLEGLPPNLTTLYIFNNQLTSLEGLQPNLTTLYISKNQIKSLVSPQGEMLLPQNLTELDISENHITSLEGLPPNLTTLYIWDNQITSLISPQGEALLPQSLTKLDISGNQLTSLEGLPPNLTTLYISNNQLTSLEGLQPNLTELYIWDNQITSLEGLPQSLTKLDISNNQLTSLEGLPPNLTTLHISSNLIKLLPIEMVHMRNLRNFSYSENPIENIHPSVQRFLNSLWNIDTRRGTTIYDDGQNVHNAIVQSSIRESLDALTKYEQLVTKSKLPQSEISFLDEKEVHSYFHFTQKEVLLFVENAIEVCKYSPSVKEELYSLLKEALREGKQVCSTGRIGRMVNVLSGFDPNVQIKISDNAQISAIVTSFRERGETKDSVAEELRSRGMKQEEIDEWLEYY